MRNLKKVLSLSLAFVMLLGMMVIGAGAVTDIDDFNDQAEITDTYREAVDLLTAIEVLEGSNGAFNPAGTLTREQAAKIIATVALGVDAAEALNTTVAPFSDVAATRWSAGYIAYCANVGVINGVGGGRFNPTGEVTGYQFAKMLLCVLGYGVNDEYVGAKWVLNVSRDATTTRLVERTTVSNDPISREEAAQLAFNALRLNLVAYSTLYGTYSAYAPGVGQQQLLGTIAQNIFRIRAVPTKDAYGYNYEYWRYNNNAAPITHDYLTDVIVGTFTEGTYGALYRAFTWDASVNIIENGQTINPVDNIFGTSPDTVTVRNSLRLGDYAVSATSYREDGQDKYYSAFNPETTLRNNATNKAIDYAGQVITAVDVDADGDVDTLIVVTAYLAEVVRVNAATASAPRNVSVRAYVPSATSSIAYVTANLETEDYAVGDKLLVDPAATLATVKADVGTTPANQSAQATLLTNAFTNACGFRAAESITGNVSAYYLNSNGQANGSVTTNATRYIYNGVYADSSAVGYEYTVEPGYTLGSASYQFYLDDVGNVIGVEVVQDSISDYVYITAVGEDQFELSNVVRVLDNTGAIKTYNISSKSDAGLYDTTPRNSTPENGANHDGMRNQYEGVGKIYSYSVDANGEIILTRLGNRYTSIYGAGIPADGFKKGLASLVYQDGHLAYADATDYTGGKGAASRGVVYANDATVFLYYDTEKGTVTRYEGRNNAPDIKDAIAAGANPVAIATQSIGNNVYANMVVITKGIDVTMNNWMYILGETGYSTSTTSGRMWYWDVIVDGEVTVIASKTQSGLAFDNVKLYSVDENGFAGDPANNAKAGLYTIGNNANGVVRGTVAVRPVNNTLVLQSSTSEKGDEYLLAENATIADVSNAKERPRTVLLPAIPEPGDEVTIVVGSNKQVSAVFITGVNQAYISEFDYDVTNNDDGKLTRVETNIKSNFSSAYAFDLYAGRNGDKSMTVAQLANATKLTNTSATFTLHTSYYNAYYDIGGYADNDTTNTLVNGTTYFIRIENGSLFNIFEITFHGNNVANGIVVNAIPAGSGVMESGNNNLNAIGVEVPPATPSDEQKAAFVNDVNGAIGTETSDYDQAYAIATGNMLNARWTASGTADTLVIKSGETVVYTENFGSLTANREYTAHVTLDYSESLGSGDITGAESFWTRPTGTTNYADKTGLNSGSYTWQITNAANKVLATGSFTIG